MRGLTRRIRCWLRHLGHRWVLRQDGWVVCARCGHAYGPLDDTFD